MDDKTLESDKEGIVDILSMLTLESDEEELKNNNDNNNNNSYKPKKTKSNK